MNTDWWNYGGLTREVLLVQTPGTFIAQYHVGLKAGTRDRIEATVQLDGPRKQQKVTVTLAGLGLKAEARTDASGVARIEFPAAQIRLWSPERPHCTTWFWPARPTRSPTASAFAPSRRPARTFY